MEYCHKLAQEQIGAEGCLLVKWLFTRIAGIYIALLEGGEMSIAAKVGKQRGVAFVTVGIIFYEPHIGIGGTAQNGFKRKGYRTAALAI